LTDWPECERLAHLCREPHTRLVGVWRDGHPSRWYPHTVADPETGEPFAEDAAWNFVSELILTRQAIRIVPLREPAGALAFEILKDMPHGTDTLYIKLALTRSGTKIIGRSFHYSERNK
jgi:hypothetical protein